MKFECLFFSLRLSINIAYVKKCCLKQARLKEMCVLPHLSWVKTFEGSKKSKLEM